MVLDPMTMALIGGGFGAAGNIAGGLLGQSSTSSGDMFMPSFNPALDPALQAAQFDALNRIGFGDINQTASPIDSLINQISGLPIEQRLSRRALRALQEIRSGENRRGETFAGDGLPGLDFATRGRELGLVLSRLGMTEDDFTQLLEQDQAFRDQRDRLADLGGLNEQTIRNRAQAANDASRLIAEAGASATGGGTSAFQSAIEERLQRNIDDQRQALLRQAQFGGFQPGRGLELLNRAEADLPITAMEQALVAASGLGNALSGGTQAAQNAAQQSAGTQLSAAGLAAQQGAAANRIRAQEQANNASSLASGVGNAFGTVGSSLGNAAFLSLLGGQNPVGPAATPRPPQAVYSNVPGSNNFVAPPAFSTWNP